MKILVGYDGSERARKALQLAQVHAGAFRAEVIHVLHAKVTDLPAKEHEQDLQDLEDVRSKLENEGFRCEVHLLVRNLSRGEQIVDFAKKNKIDEIVIGVKLRSKVGKFIMGSTAQYVILEAPCPVVTTK